MAKLILQPDRDLLGIWTENGDPRPEGDSMSALVEPVALSPVLAACRWPSNAELIADCARLGYLRREWLTLDPTFENGVWWKRWRPDNLVTHNRAEDGSDFRDLPYPDGHFDAIAYDPPYVSVGGRKTTTMPDFHRRFGLHDAPTTPALLQELIDQGLTEMRRLVKPQGYVLVKCQDYISSGKLWHGTYLTQAKAWALGFEVVDRLEHIGDPRPQPTLNPDGSPRRQVHARRNLSTLFVLRAPRHLMPAHKNPRAS